MNQNSCYFHTFKQNSVLSVLSVLSLSLLHTVHPAKDIMQIDIMFVSRCRDLPGIHCVHPVASLDVT
jgi:hypothetical protein